MMRPTAKSSQNWKVTQMHQWPLGTSSESPPRGGEHVIQLSLSVHGSHHILSCGLSHHTTCCWCVCWWPCTNLTNSWCPEFIGSQIHQDHQSPQLISVLLNVSCPPPLPNVFLFLDYWEIKAKSYCCRILFLLAENLFSPLLGAICIMSLQNLLLFRHSNIAVIYGVNIMWPGDGQVSVCHY